ncbi:MAG: cation-transporting P-type ATPase [Candidatus Binataceae bacterium]
MQIHQLSAADAIASLNRSPQGLSSVEAMRRLSEYGLNRVEEVARESILLRFLKEFTHFFALILWLAAGLAFVASGHLSVCEAKLCRSRAERSELNRALHRG